MSWHRSTVIAGRLVVLPRVDSTNDAMARAVAAASGGPDRRAEPDFSVIATTDQTAGRGRLGRSWSAPPGTSLAVSVLLRPVSPGGAPLPLECFGWLPLIAGLAMSRAVASLLEASHRGPSGDGPPRVGLKWPNDVQVGGSKIAGLLAELVPRENAVVIGAGLNLTMTADQLPVPTATSLALCGVDPAAHGPGPDDLADAALSRYLVQLRELSAAFAAAGGDAEASGIRTALRQACTTLGGRVRVQLPGGTDLIGTAIDLDADGRLVVRHGSDGAVSAVAAGDVTHLRYE